MTLTLLQRTFLYLNFCFTLLLSSHAICLSINFYKKIVPENFVYKKTRGSRGDFLCWCRGCDLMHEFGVKLMELARHDEVLGAAANRLNHQCQLGWHFTFGDDHEDSILLIGSDRNDAAAETANLVALLGSK